MQQVQKLVLDKGCPWEDAERMVFGFSHADLGAMLAQRWESPEEIVLAIRFHHPQPGDQTYPIVDMVMVANVVARCIGEGIGSQGMEFSVDSTCRDRLGVTKEDLDWVCATTAVAAEALFATYAATT